MQRTSKDCHTVEQRVVGHVISEAVHLVAVDQSGSLVDVTDRSILFLSNTPIYVIEQSP
jgi:hypothetical protein